MSFTFWDYILEFLILVFCVYGVARMLLDMLHFVVYIKYAADYELIKNKFSMWVKTSKPSSQFNKIFKNFNSD